MSVGCISRIKIGDSIWFKRRDSIFSSEATVVELLWRHRALQYPEGYYPYTTHSGVIHPTTHQIISIKKKNR